MRPPLGASLAILDALRDGPMCVTAVVQETGLSQSNVSNHLGRLRALGWVTGERAGRQVLYQITDYFVEQFVRSQERPSEPLGIRARRRIAGELLPGLVQALTEGSEPEARRLTHEALLRGLTWKDLYLFLFTPAMREVGSAWQAGSLCVTREHEATALVERLMARVHPGGAPRPDAPTVVVACVESNLHELGARMAADFFIAAGWRVHYFGANTPTASLERAAADADVVALSVSQPDQLPSMRDAAARLRKGRRSIGPNGNGAHHRGPSRRARTRPLLLAGGRAVTGYGPSDLGVDLVDDYLPHTLRCLERQLC